MASRYPEAFSWGFDHLYQELQNMGVEQTLISQASVDIRLLGALYIYVLIESEHYMD
jgi:hypothetical protein